jgi:t-SNARE complex subunit (syntaxin)
MEAIFDPLTVSSMEDITSNSWTSFFVIFLIIIAILAIVAYVWYEGKRGLRMIDKQASGYERLYTGIQSALDNWKINERSYNVISKLFDQLRELPYKDSEMTEVLNNQFMIKYSSVRDEINSREEFNPGQVLKK